MSTPDGSFLQRLRMCPASVSPTRGTGSGNCALAARTVTLAPAPVSKQLPDIVHAVDDFATSNADPAANEILDDPRADDMAPLLYLARCCSLLAAVSVDADPLPR